MTVTTPGPVVPDHLLDLAEWDALDEEVIRRAELVEGVLVVAPSASPRHQRLSWRLCAALEAELAPRWALVPDIDVLVDEGPPPTVRRPDVVVVRAPALARGPRFAPADVLAVAEILSPGSRRTDRIAKRGDYADAGIAHYLLVEPGPPVSITELTLDGGAYRLVAEHTGGEAGLALGATIDLAALA